MWTQPRAISRIAVLGLAVASASLSACNRQPKVDDASMARLREPERRKIADAQHRVDVAAANMNAAEAGVQEAKQFRDITDKEVSAAKDQVDAAEGTKDLGRQTRNPSMATSAERAEESATTRVRAAEAKKAYADALVDYREDKRDLAKARLSLAEAQRERVKFDIASKAGTAGKSAQSDFMKAEEDATADVQKAEAKVKESEARSNQAKDTWTKTKANITGTPYRDTPAPAEPPEVNP